MLRWPRRDPTSRRQPHVIARFTGRPTDSEHPVLVRTSGPRRDFMITLGADAVSLEPADLVDEPDLEIPAEVGSVQALSLSARLHPNRNGVTIEHMFDWMDRLNEAQLAAVTHEGGPLRVLAGAGTGKTTALSARVAWLLANGTPPERVLLLTFTRRAARQMLHRTDVMLASQQQGS